MLSDDIAQSANRATNAVGNAIGSAIRGAILFGLIAAGIVLAINVGPILIGALFTGNLAAVGTALLGSLTSAAMWGGVVAAAWTGVRIGAILFGITSFIPGSAERAAAPPRSPERSAAPERVPDVTPPRGQDVGPATVPDTSNPYEQPGLGARVIRDRQQLATQQQAAANQR